MLVCHSSEDNQPAERFDDFSDQHPNCSWRQRVVAKERVGGSSQMQVISRWSHLPLPYICHTQTPTTYIATPSLLFCPSSFFVCHRVCPSWSRLERLENEVKSSQGKFEEITRGWSTAEQMVIPQELQEAVNNQKELCAALIEDKKKHINDLQQVNQSIYLSYFFSSYLFNIIVIN